MKKCQVKGGAGGINQLEYKCRLAKQSPHTLLTVLQKKGVPQFTSDGCYC